MALTQDEKILVAEYVGAGIILREIGDRLLSGRVTVAENSLFKSLVKHVGRFAGRTAVSLAGTAGMVARKHPAGVILAAGLIARQQGVSMDTALAIAQDEIETIQYHQRQVSPLLAPVQIARGIERVREFEPVGLPGGGLGRGQPAGSRALRRKISRANTAVKQGMKWLRQGTKAGTGAMPGKLPAGAFRTAVKAAGLANPNTKSRPKKGKSIMNKLARRLKKWW